MTLNDWATILGFGIAVVGLTLSILNYLRDRVKLKVILRWDMELITTSPLFKPEKLWGSVSITNAGRRPTYVGHVVLRLPKKAKGRMLIFKEGLGGEELKLLLRWDYLLSLAEAAQRNRVRMNRGLGTGDVCRKLL